MRQVLRVDPNAPLINHSKRIRDILEAGLLVNEEKDVIEGDPEEEVNADVESTQESTEESVELE